MEKSSGLKECPRCGLRNRRGANQCDFCGWDFKGASDDWMGKVNDLEKLKQEVEVSTLDRSTRSKIELTIKKPADMPVPEKRPEKQLEVPAPLTLEEQGEVAALHSTEETYTEAEPEVEAPSEPEAMEVAQQLVAPPPEPIEESKPVEEPAEMPSVTVVAKDTVTETPVIVPAVLLIAGLILYAAALFLTSSHTLDKVFGWVIVIAASISMAFGVMRLLPRLKGHRSDEEETVLCPICHEIVSENDAKCPSCGVKFKESSLRDKA